METFVNGSDGVESRITGGGIMKLESQQTELCEPSRQKHMFVRGIVEKRRASSCLYMRTVRREGWWARMAMVSGQPSLLEQALCVHAGHFAAC